MLHIKNNEVIEPNRNDIDSCPVCNNRIGFSFGTCCECGFNHISADFKFIKVHTDYLPNEIKDVLIKIHAKKYKVESVMFE